MRPGGWALLARRRLYNVRLEEETHKLGEGHALGLCARLGGLQELRGNADMNAGFLVGGFHGVLLGADHRAVLPEVVQKVVKFRVCIAPAEHGFLNADLAVRDIDPLPFGGARLALPGLRGEAVPVRGEGG